MGIEGDEITEKLNRSTRHDIFAMAKVSQYLINYLLDISHERYRNATEKIIEFNQLKSLWFPL